jgi:N-methylhydantoinase A
MDLRYPHQGYELAMDCEFEEPTEHDLELLRVAFDRLHEQIYGVAAPGEPCEIVNLRIRAVVPVQSPETPAGELGDISSESAKVGEREVYFDSLGTFSPTPVFDRDFLHPGAVITGPAVVEQLDTTTIIGPGWTASSDRYGTLVVERDR